MSPGCGPECVIDPDCEYGLVCRDQRCIERPDPCVPSPCGPGTTCTANTEGNPICRCLPGLVPKPDTITGELMMILVVMCDILRDYRMWSRVSGGS